MFYRFGILILFGVFASLASPQLHAQDAVLIVVSNNTGQAASDLHIRLDGGNGNLFADPLAVFAPGCPTPTVLSNPPASSNRVDIDWGVPCVQPGKFVAVLVSTVNGPLTFNSAYWTLNGVNIGNINPNDISFQTITLPPGAVYGGTTGGTGGTTITFQTRYRPCPPSIYTPWVGGVATCWFRFCCFPAGFQCEFRMVVCTTGAFGGLFGNACTSTTGWVPAGKTGPVYFWARLTYPPRIICNPILFGPAPNPPGFPDEPGEPGDLGAVGPTWETAKVIYRNEETGVSRESTNFEATFLEMAGTLSREFENLDAPTTFEEITSYLGPKYVDAGKSLTPLIDEAKLVLETKLSPLEHNTVKRTQRILKALQSQLFAVGRDLTAGVNSSEPYRRLDRALTALAINGENIGSMPRYANAGRNLRSMAAGISASADFVDKGLGNTEQRDFFLWGLMNRFEPMIARLATSTAPHVRVELDLGDHQWSPSDVGHGVEFKLQDRESNRIFDKGTLRLSDLSTVDLRMAGDRRTANAWFKLPTHLSKVVQVSYIDGKTIDGGKLIAGDVNGDNCINMRDLDEVIDSFGEGGRFAKSVPSADVNFDGIVDDVDYSIVRSNLGKCGQRLRIAPTKVGDR